eukprot:TRINITY_DN61622_c0_g1_i1.p1 TRINITY_DN61622_c0_g1~~TRINITY_DN61622_c0_g1_i1.p1  ORF type:complete len:329 (-),score=64.03 TRINITY_DN61622_c0_g1_i1:71-1057(-)
MAAGERRPSSGDTPKHEFSCGGTPRSGVDGDQNACVDSDSEDGAPLSQRSDTQDPEGYRTDPGLRVALEALDAASRFRPTIEAFAIEHYLGSNSDGADASVGRNGGGYAGAPKGRERRLPSPRRRGDSTPPPLRDDLPALLIDCPSTARGRGRLPSGGGGNANDREGLAAAAAVAAANAAPCFSTDMLMMALRVPPATSVEGASARRRGGGNGNGGGGGLTPRSVRGSRCRSASQGVAAESPVPLGQVAAVATAGTSSSHRPPRCGGGGVGTLSGIDRSGSGVNSSAVSRCQPVPPPGPPPAGSASRRRPSPFPNSSSEAQPSEPSRR